MLRHLIFLTLFTVPGVSAEGWEDFANNFAADLAPLVALFGERLTKQFLSESTSLLDNFIFALSPLGILTAVVSVIRICGNSSLRAFVGRANEAPGEAENELLSCVSDATAELFNDGGISRVSGRPRILEVMVWEEPNPCGQSSYKIGTLRYALREGSWSMDGGEYLHEKDHFSFPELDIPNLSLNKGIERRGRRWFYVAALIGTALQGGTLIFSALTVFWYPDRFQNDGKPAETYAFPVYACGSISLSLGMFLCAYMIERSSSENYFHPTKPSKIYWLQPGRQTIGEQDFGAFLAVNEGPDSQATQELTYIKSIRCTLPKGKRVLLMFTIAVTMLGFVLKFVGLRGLHPSVIIADVGSTLLMAVVRTCLRAKRIGSDGNRFCKEDRELTSHNQQELDCFAFQLEKIESFRLVSSPVHHTARSRSGSCSTGDSSIISTPSFGLGSKLIQTRARLAELTSSTSHPSMDWDDLPIRKVAHDLASTIEMTMELVSRWKEVSGSTCSFELSFACQALSHKSTGSALETYPIVLKRSDDTFQWRVDANELEAILGLWVYSLLKSNSKWLQNGLGRAVGLTKSEASAETTDLYFHKWIFRQREARMVSSRMISFSEQTFGYYSDEYPEDKDILVVKTENKLEAMAAQDIYIQFLMSILTDLKSLGGDVNMVARSQNSFFAQNTHLDELVSCFETGSLGSREDALLCIVPVLKHRNLLPELAADSSCVRERVKGSISNANWGDAFSILQWLCERCEGEEFERSVYELGLLCQQAMLARNANTREKGFERVRSLLQRDVRSKFFGHLRSPRPSNWMDSHAQNEWWVSFSSQLGWVAWHIANRQPERQAMRQLLESIGYTEDLSLQVRVNTGHMDPNPTQNTLLGVLIPDIEVELLEASQDGFENCLAQCLDWIVSTGQCALCHWFLVKWAELGQRIPHYAMKSFVFTAKSNSSSIRTLLRLGADINALGIEGCPALVELVATGHMDATKKLLENGADANARTKVNGYSPMIFAAARGNEEALLLLLDHGADLELGDEWSRTGLHIASQENQIDSVALLLDKGADIEAIAKDERTPMLSAAAEGHHDMVDCLLRRGANINATDNRGMTALMIAVSCGSEAVVRLLLDKKSNIQKQDNFGSTALDLAHESGFGTIAAILKAAS
ncbi:hypothetical protein BDW59DRAFT_2979 [Aspergillus cavernicola]|uniref:Ankyrin repeat-containing domain protein n=1 Tax=Aspergillus cavernicola TaxID=176166 RepID=A0ABR4J4W3_9EURO